MAVVFDAAHFDHMTGADAALKQEILQLFRGQIANWTPALSPTAPGPNWRDIVHTMKGSARGIGLWALAEACEQAETKGEPGLPDVNAALAEALKALP
jgi:HPt (histidine-containing phosphotransfer) domain-containing protein